MKPLTIAAILLGIIFLVVSAIYFVEPAKSLPVFFPGYDTTLTKVHKTHALGSLAIALCLFAYAWFKTGKKSSKKE